jgi:hypothetical protein
VKLIDTAKTKLDTTKIETTVIEPIHDVNFIKENPSVELQGEVESIEEEIMGDTVMPAKPKEVLKGKVKISPPDTSRFNPEKLIHTMGMIAPEYKVEAVKINSN